MKEIKWRAPEFHYYHKGPGWYWISVMAAIVLIGFALWQKNFLFAVFIVIAELVILNWAQRRPADTDFSLDDKGLVIGGRKVYSYDALAGFAVKDQELILKKKSKLNPYFKILISEYDAGRIKDFLAQHLPEIEYEESLIEHLARLLKF